MMGQAKQRGTLEQRRTEAMFREAVRMEKRRQEIEATKQRRREWEAANPKEAAARKAKSLRVNLMLATILGLSAGAQDKAGGAQ